MDGNWLDQLYQTPLPCPCALCSCRDGWCPWSKTPVLLRGVV